MNNIKHMIEGSWDEIKGKIQSKWGKLTDNDLEKIDGSYTELTGRLQKLYGYKASQVQREIEDFFDSGDFDRIKNKALNKVNEIKNIVFETLDEYFQSAKRKSIDAERAIVEYVSENPLKTIGFAAAAGVLVGCLCKGRRD